MLQDLVQARKTLGFTQAEMAVKLGITRNYLALMETGRRRVKPELVAKANAIVKSAPSPADKLTGAMPAERVRIVDYAAKMGDGAAMGDGASPALCRFPADCDMIGRLAALEAGLKQVAIEQAAARILLETLVGLRGAAGRAETDAQKRKAG